ncbi:pyridoxamine 5'-phosphate oxidase family protein [Fictibacillus sp. KU28468]|uniref:pyridoxamine 5'-phosphate oxidase family protein n=1 Tax=Fictibacillus sp. KU28468 TaxID=2991053 RepID=UPI00223E50CF|nr:pyridoxamine 5'-phosphate oxidase family protein [Fictibacillus sp. KU28468]UZJ77938.1 pyridoxamine 5'-phosphate oxidase family protein [Fictibacillus sp. KU28468]
MSMKWQEIIDTEEEFEKLRSLCGTPSIRAENKVISYLDQHCREFIGMSPFLTLATCDSEGRCDVSPRGDIPGFVTVLDEHHLFIPERLGNKRMDSAQNILTNPGTGLLFMIPGLGETLRVNGKAFICRDKELLELSTVNGKLPLFGIVVKAEECYLHCAKAFIRSGLWCPESWEPKESLPSAAKMLAAHMNIPNMSTEQVEEGLQEGYRHRLY